MNTDTLPTGYPRGGSSARTDYSVADGPRGYSNMNVGNVLNSYNTISLGVDEESSRVQAWLSPLEPRGRHRDVRKHRLDGVGDWVLQRNEFESWRKGLDGLGNPTLLCYGGQGVGKTFISSLVIDTLRGQARGQNIAVLALYCDYQAQKDQSAINIIGGLLGQVARRGKKIPDEIKSAFEESEETGGQSLRLPDMLKLFTKTISSIERVYICVDAVDELLPQCRSELLRALRQIVQDAPNTRLFLTGRPYVRGELDKHLTRGAHIIHVVADKGDITRYVSQKMDNDDDRDPDLMTENLKNDIMKTILERSSEMFLLVSLNIDAILGETSVASRKRMLKQVATTGVDLDGVYAQTLRRIREQKGGRSRLGVEVLMWVSHSERPLRIDELRHALAVEMESTDLDPENIRPQDTVLGSCLGLVVVDKETSTVRLIHYTLQEYLSRPGILPDSHKTLAQTCLTYLNYDQVKGLPAKNGISPGELPFLEYSSVYWGSHAERELSDRTKSLVLELFKRFDHHISATLLFNRIKSYHSPFVTQDLFTGLHCASHFGIVEVVTTLIEVEGSDINQRDCNGFTPLAWAAKRGNGVVVRLLLARNEINPDSPDNYGRTPLWWASMNGCVDVVRLLLTRRDVNPGNADSHGKTPLWRASKNGHEGVVGLLLARENVDPDKPDSSSQTPLCQASRNGHEGVVRLLLTRSDVNPDKVDNDGQTPLWWASFYGNEGVAGLLLTRDDVNPEKRNNFGQTPLLIAAGNGNEGVVRLLLARGNVNPDTPDNGGQTPLYCASESGHEGLVRLLLALDGVHPDRPDNYGQTALWCASWNGHEGVVRLLLTRTDVNPDRADNYDRTPLFIACWNGNEGVVRLLFSRDDVNPDKPDNRGRTPLWGASREGNDRVVQLLLTRDINPIKPDNNDQTPLLIASLYKHREVVALLQPRITAIPRMG